MSVVEQEGRYLIELVRSILMDEELKAAAAEHDWNVVYYLACRHSLVALVYDALQKNNIVLPEELNAKFYEAYCKAFVKEGIFQHEYECLVEEFQKIGVRMVPLKGCILKSYYPQPWHRSMSDMDFLIKPEDRESVKACMEQMGYTVEHYGFICHDVYFKQPVVNIEIHYQLFKDIYPLWRDFFQNITLHKVQDGTYCMSNEDTYLYLLAHTAKHLKSEGSGIRQILDLWLYWQRTELDENYIKDNLQKLKLDKLHNTAQKLAQYWLLVPMDSEEQMEGLTRFFIQNGVYGNKENYFMHQVNNVDGTDPRQQKRKVILSRLFPPMEELKKWYPVLRKWPVLLPAVHIKRACKFVFFKSNKEYMKGLTNLDEDKIEAFQSYMEDLFGE